MPGLLTATSVMMCPHGGTVQAITSNTRTQAAGDFVLRASDTFLVVSCPFVLGVVPHPCIQVQWVVPSSTSQVIGDFVLTEVSVGLCSAPDQVVQGVVIIVAAQPRVSGL